MTHDQLRTQDLEAELAGAITSNSLDAAVLMESAASLRKEAREMEDKTNG